MRDKKNEEKQLRVIVIETKGQDNILLDGQDRPLSKEDLEGLEGSEEMWGKHIQLEEWIQQGIAKAQTLWQDKTWADLVIENLQQVINWEQGN